MVKIDIISGFLGAGKTTLIKKLLKEAFEGEQVVLIENEFGEIGIDGGFLKDAGIEIREMNSGCICCSLVGDFGASLKEVVEKYHPDRILIEPSGVGKLSDVIMLIVATRNGQAIRFNEEDARPMGRSGHGVRAIKLAEGDEVVGVCICRENATILTVTENGKGRRSDIDTYRITARGGKGIRNYDASKDKVAAVKIVDDVDDVLLSSQEGIIIRLHANEIPVQSRYGSGVRVMRLGENDKVMVLARTDHDDEAQTETVEAEEGDEPTAEQLAAMEAADEASASEAPAED